VGATKKTRGREGSGLERAINHVVLYLKRLLFPLLCVSIPVAALAAFGNGCNLGPANCSTGQVSRVEEGERMEPGGDCISCHRDEGPRYTVAGTVMGAATDSDTCVGVPDVTVELTDANGVVLTLTANSVGNFFTRQAVAMPYTARVLSGGKERKMVAAQTDGDCASCHTDEGANGAPGRVLAP